MKRWHTEKEKIFANHVSDKGLIFRIQKISQLNDKQKTRLQIDKELIRYFPKDFIQWP